MEIGHEENGASLLRAAFKPTGLDLASKLARKLESKKEIPIPTPESRYRVSSLVKMCPREEVFRHVHQVKKFETIDARLQRVFDFGTAIHEFVQNNWFSEWLVGEWRCASCGLVHPGMLPKACGCGGDDFRYKEIRMETDLVTGHTDGVLLIEGKQVLLEIKTCSSKQFELIVNIRKAPIQSHVDQVQLYMWLLGVSEAVIVYLEKDESLLSQFVIKRDDAVAEGFVQRIRDAREGMISKIPPPREICANSTCARAKACSTRSFCFA